jgi:hypothetical protein
MNLQRNPDRLPMSTHTFKPYARVGIVEATPWVPNFDMSLVVITQTHLGEGHPKPGGMITRERGHHDTMWYLPEDYFARHYEPVLDVDAMLLANQMAHMVTDAEGNSNALACSVRAWSVLP